LARLLPPPLGRYAAEPRYLIVQPS